MASQSSPSSLLPIHTPARPCRIHLDGEYLGGAERIGSRMPEQEYRAIGVQLEKQSVASMQVPRVEIAIADEAGGGVQRVTGTVFSQAALAERRWLPA